MTKTYRSRRHISLHIKNEFGKLEEEKFIYEFFKGVPIDELKKLINFKVIDPTKDNPESPQEKEYLSGLMDKWVFEYRAEIII